MTEDVGTSGPEATDSARHLLDWGAPPCPKGGLADRKDVVVAEIRELWTSFDKVDIPAAIAAALIQWAVQHPPGDKPFPVILKAFGEARHDPDTHDGFKLANRLLEGRNVMLGADALERHDPVPDIIIQGANLPTKRRRGSQPKPERREFLAIEVAKASWVTGLKLTREDAEAPDEHTSTSDIPSAVDLVARATQFSYRHVLEAWSTPIDGRLARYLLERWERESNEPG